MTEETTKEVWSRFQTDVKSLAGELHRHYKDADDTTKAAEINSALRQIGQATEKFFASLDVAASDPEVRATTKQAARSFGAALAGTFREVGEELDKALRQKTPPT
jgi:flagellar hook-associated protein FlgK